MVELNARTKIVPITYKKKAVRYSSHEVRCVFAAVIGNTIKTKARKAHVTRLYTRVIQNFIFVLGSGSGGGGILVSL